MCKGRVMMLCFLVPGKSSPFNEAWNFCKERSKSIEVFYKNQDGVRILTRVHFKFQKKVLHANYFLSSNYTS